MGETTKHIRVDGSLHRQLRILSAEHNIHIEDFVSASLRSVLANEAERTRIIKALKKPVTCLLIYLFIFLIM